MTDSRKKRLSMLDDLAAAGAAAPDAEPAPATPMMRSNRALRSARDAVDAHHVWELAPDDIVDERMADRLDPEDVYDLRDAIEANGQTVPILVRRHPTIEGRYQLVYGRRRLEAIRLSDKVGKIRALVAQMDDRTALTAQVSENMARRDLSFIEKALFARQLVSSGYGNQVKVAEVLTVTKSAISMSLAIVDMIGEDLIQAIGPAHGIGRPRWEALGKAIEDRQADRARLTEIAYREQDRHLVDAVTDDMTPPVDLSVAAFEAVIAAVAPPADKKPRKAASPRSERVVLRAGADQEAAVLKRGPRGVTLEMPPGAFADWVATRAHEVIEELHERWSRRSED